jgi:NADH-quinone oxidoreductase subunit L
LLFLGAGSVIHAMHHEQDMRKMGGLARKLPVTWLMMLIGTLALTGVGIPHLGGFAGFHSKDAIVEAAYAAHTPSDYAFWLLVIAAFMTSFYSWRLMFMTFHGATRADHHTYDHAHESPLVMLIPLGILAVGAVLAGIVFTGYFIGEGRGEFWRAALYEAPGKDIFHHMHEVPATVAWAPTLAMLAGLGLATLYYVVAPGLPAVTARVFRPLYLFFLNKWYFDELYDALFVRPAFRLGRFLWKSVDGAIIDGLIDGTARAVIWGTGRVVRLQTGYVYHYAFAMLIGVAALLTYFMFAGGPQP